MNASYFLFANPNKAETIPTVKRVTEWLEGSGFAVFMERWLSEKIGLGHAADLKDMAETPRAVISIGGDGTLLRVIADAARKGVPVLGINFGHLGFLMESTAEEADGALTRLLSGDYWVEERMMLEAKTDSGDRYLVMNDVALMRGQHPSSIQVKAFADEELIFTVRGDGVLVSTPTGTTGYAVSAGASIVCPDLACISVVPVCSHVLFQRPVVLRPETAVRVCLCAHDARTHQLIIDGQFILPIDGRKSVTVRKAAIGAKFIRFGQPRFINRLRQKQAEWSIEF